MLIDKELIKGSSKTVILQLLSKKGMHGYELSSQIKSLTQGAIEISEGTIYPTLHSLEADGYIESQWAESEGKRKRKVYKITSSGRKLLKERKASWNDFLKAMQSLLPVKSNILEA
ncbi:MAG TPA: PadR family transcriptional regulator [Bdellovibrionales bacterium]|nr:PadR family transcriptional regulator [Pseudobdellovibrionaceae bacterium]HAG90764.1 PadR family transcriptional regulator [Bdellovibrionales bacterium]|tara:strand:- start:1268 stop:1615 length:348 start_codon:yes stop_codon:yes gene_type:complete